MASTRTFKPALLLASCMFVCLLVGTSVECWPQTSHHHEHHQRSPASMFAARRAADDSRPISHVHHHHQHHHHLNLAASQEAPVVVMGKFKAPAPERIYKHRIPKSSDFGTQTMSASFRVAGDDSSMPEKVVHGVAGSSATATIAGQQQKQARSNLLKVSAKMQVSDEGLNYPPSKMSADIYGNVAEIVTAPPEAVESDFLVPQSSRHFGARRLN